MNVMLFALFAAVVIGLLGSPFGRWQHIAIGVMATTMTGLYFFLQRTW
jgi:hypothetical protein